VPNTAGGLAVHIQQVHKLEPEKYVFRRFPMSSHQLWIAYRVLKTQLSGNFHSVMKAGPAQECFNAFESIYILVGEDEQNGVGLKKLFQSVGGKLNAP
jgi:hypothetical protein